MYIKQKKLFLFLQDVRDQDVDGGGGGGDALPPQAVPPLHRREARQGTV